MKNVVEVVSGSWGKNSYGNPVFIMKAVVGETTSQGHKKASQMLGCKSVQMHNVEGVGYSWVPSWK